jgi:hypothetical protein
MITLTPETAAAFSAALLAVGGLLVIAGYLMGRQSK